MTTVCEVCGNRRDGMNLLCPFCGSKSEFVPQIKKKQFIQKTVNLEAGHPVVDQALQKMHEIVQDAVRQGVNVLTLIHGYGSTGKGGVIRMECRKTLEYLLNSNKVHGFIPGEEFNQRSRYVKALLNRYPQLKNNTNLNKANKGITLVILS